MKEDFLGGTLGKTGMNAFRLGLSMTYRPGRDAVADAVDAGVNYFFGYGFDRQLVTAMRDIFKGGREKYILATGAYNLILGHQDVRRTLERRLRQFRTDYIDVFMFLGVMKPGQFPERAREELCRLREEGKVKAIGLSTHDRKFAGRLAAEGLVDVLMIRYNAAHRGAESDIFPHLQAHDTGLVSYTATRWSYLLRRPRGYPRDGRISSAGMAYRFVLSNPDVDVCLTAPRNRTELKENLAAVREGPLSAEEMAFMKEFGDRVHDSKKWFM